MFIVIAIVGHGCVKAMQQNDNIILNFYQPLVHQSHVCVYAI